MNWPAYLEYDDADVEWLGSIPRGWQTTRLKHITATIPGGTPDTDNEDFWNQLDDGTPWVAIGDMSQRDDVHTARKHLTAAGLASKGLQLGPAGTVLFAMYASVGEVAMLRTPAVWNQALLGVLPISDLCEAKFLFYSLLTVKGRLPSLYRSNTQDNLNAQQVGNLAIALPTLREQGSISDFLDRETGKIDALIDKQHQLIETLREDRTATITHAVTKGLNPDVGMTETGNKWLGEVPEHWKPSRLKDLIVSIESGTSVNGADAPSMSGGIGVLKTSAVSTGMFNPNANKSVFEEDKARVTCPVEGDTLIVNRANTPQLVGTAAYSRAPIDNLYLSDKLWQARFLESFGEFVYFWSQSPVYRSQVSVGHVGASASMQNLSIDEFKKIFISVAPATEAQRVVNFLNVQVARLDALVESVNHAVRVLLEYRSALITAAVTGKIDVREAA